MRNLIKKILKESIKGREETFTNKYGEDMTLILNPNGKILFKHTDYKNEFIPLDNIYDKINGIRVNLHKEEKDFFNNFIKGTVYER
jgi:hypothetical protein